MSIRRVAAALDTHPATSAVLLANHLACGTDPLAAARLVVAIEEAAGAELAAAAIGSIVDFPPGALERVRGSMAAHRAPATTADDQ